MKRRTFIGSTVGAVFLAGCSSSGDDTGSTTTGTDQSTTTPTDEMTGTTEAGETTAAESTTSETASETTTSDSSTTTETRTAAFGAFVTVADGLEVAVTEADTSNSYEHDGTTTKSGDGKTFLFLTFKAKNTAQSSQSLPDGTTVSVQANDEQYDVTKPAAEKWQQFASSSVNAGGSASTSVAFEVPKKAVSSFGVAVQLSYTESGAKRAVRWNME
ncbi:DUF4352 domain-containing protein [Haladaptatus sp. DFWS20]|uniref:DUF4352 domain-containing protein n=1 Tax=Haladaptatus sp. DFWS20 TaxID=3403467 RepID=UPI003EB739EA